ncbi:hypothetical protein ACWEQL_28325 [Kitasatospora sp. NPDC004240]
MPYRLDVTEGDWPAGDPAKAEDLRKGVEGILAGSLVLTLATAGPERGPHANPLFFAYDEDLVLYFVSARSTRHSLHLTEEARASASVFLPPSVFGEELRGVQLSGSAGEAWGWQAQAALAAYQGRFPAFARAEEARRQFLDGGGAAALYRFQVDEITVVDDQALGRHNHLRARVVR